MAGAHPSPAIFACFLGALSILVVFSEGQRRRLETQTDAPSPKASVLPRCSRRGRHDWTIERCQQAAGSRHQRQDGVDPQDQHGMALPVCVWGGGGRSELAFLIRTLMFPSTSMPSAAMPCCLHVALPPAVPRTSRPIRMRNPTCLSCSCPASPITIRIGPVFHGQTIIGSFNIHFVSCQKSPHEASRQEPRAKSQDHVTTLDDACNAGTRSEAFHGRLGRPHLI